MPHEQRALSPFECIERVELNPEAYTQEEKLEAWQVLHDTGIGYRLQGWYGRALRSLLSAGLINK